MVSEYSSPDIERSPAVFSGNFFSFDETPFVVLGIPLDMTGTYRAGTEGGPLAIRKASEDTETYSWRCKFDFMRIGACDLGDLKIVPGELEKTLDRLKVIVGDLVSRGKIPILLGGEHTITVGAARALADLKTGLVVFDAHTDLRDSYRDIKLGDATCMRRIAELIGSSNILEVGVRATSDQELRFADASGITYVTSEEIVNGDLSTIASRIRDSLGGFRKIYISLDFDVLDPSFAPGVGNPEPEGISVRNLLDLLSEIVDDRVLGFDLNEVNPLFDPSCITARAASHVVYEVCSLLHTSICHRNRAGNPASV
jgi:agmatinase